MKRLKLPAGILSFEKIRDDGYDYVDKTRCNLSRLFLLLFSAGLFAQDAAIRPVDPVTPLINTSCSRFDDVTEVNNAVVPIDWNRFITFKPNDANAELQVTISKNAIKYALNNWYAGKYGSQSVEGRYLDILRGDVNIEFKVRGPAMQADGIATAIKLGLYDAGYTGVSEQAALEICAKLVQSVARQHKVNFEGGWGGDWQGDFWAAITGHAGWLTWEQYDDKDQELIRKMVEWEANRRMNDTTPYLRKKDVSLITPGDTKAEENAWNSNVLFIACAMMPRHDNYNKWFEKAVELVISAYSHPKDVESDTVVNGRQLKEWLNGSNTEDNYAVVNHNRIHPDYMAAATLNLWNASMLTLCGKSTPEGVFFNVDKVYRALVEWNYPSPPYNAPGGTMYQPGSAEFYFPQGNDWGPCRYLTHGAFSAEVHAYRLDTTLTHNGACWENLFLQRTLELQNRFDDGHMFGDASECTYQIREEQMTHENAKAIWAKWTVLQPNFTITKDAW